MQAIVRQSAVRSDVEPNVEHKNCTTESHYTNDEDVIVNGGNSAEKNLVAIKLSTWIELLTWIELSILIEFPILIELSLDDK